MIYLETYIQPLDWEYGDIAENIARNAGFARIDEFSQHLEQTSSHAPFYPYFLSIFYRIKKIPVVFAVIFLIQIIIASFTVLVFYCISIILFNKKAGLLTAFALAFYPPLIYYSTKLTPTIFFIFFIGLTLVSLLKTRKKAYLTAIITGFFLGVSILINPLAFAFIPALIIMFLAYRQTDLKTLTVVILSAVMILIPWTLRNLSVHHRIVPVTTQFAKNFWIGNNEKATGTDYYRVSKNEKENSILMTNTLPRNAKNHLATIPEIERSDFFVKQGVEFIKQNPVQFAALLLKKTYYFWWFTPPEVNGSFDAQKYRNIYIICYFPLLILGTIGIAMSLRKPYAAKSSVLVIIILTIAAAYILTHVGLARYRIPVEVLLMIFATQPVVFLIDRMHSRTSSSRTA